MVKVSIITVVYNAAEDLEKTIYSVEEQTYPNIEYIVVDGGSTDNTVLVANKHIDSINIFISEKDYGIYDAMNKGISKAHGDYLFFLNAGDVFFNANVVSNVASCISSTVVYYGKALFVSKNKNWVYKKIVNRFNLTRKNICHQTIFYPAKVFQKEGRYDLSYPILADWILNIRAFRHFTFKYIDIVICKFDTNGISFSSATDLHFLKSFPNIIRENLGVAAFCYYEARQITKRLLNIKR